MKRHLCQFVVVVSSALGFASCADSTERKPVGPPSSQTSNIPWNSPIAGQGQGQMGMMPQNQYRR